MQTHSCVLQNPQKAKDGSMSSVPFSLPRSCFPMSYIYGWWKVLVLSLVPVGRRYVSPFLISAMVILTCYSGAPCVVRSAVLSFGVAIAFENTMFRALGRAATGLVSRCNLRVVTPFFTTPTLTQPSIQIRNHRRDAIATTFKGDTGNMVPIVCCEEHDASKRVLFDMCETDETGEVIVPERLSFAETY